MQWPFIKNAYNNHMNKLAEKINSSNKHCYVMGSAWFHRTMFQVCYFKAGVSFSVKIKDLGAYGMLFCMYNKGSGIPPCWYFFGIIKGWKLLLSRGSIKLTFWRKYLKLWKEKYLNRLFPLFVYAAIIYKTLDWIKFLSEQLKG